MFVYSKMHAWQNEPAVQQVLVFSSPMMEASFEEAYCRVTNNRDPVLVAKQSDSGMGAIYKLRAVLNSDDQYDPVIRCGFTGIQLAELTPEVTPEEAIQACKIYIKNKINTSLE